MALPRCAKAAALRFQALVFLLLTATAAQTETLPIRVYTITDGLPRDHINRIVPDSRGFLWLCTSEGLSRFDGYKFTNYGEEQGLKERRVNGFLETHSGDYWVGTEAGLFKLNPNATQPQPIFTEYSPAKDKESRNVETLLEDRNHVVWCATFGGLYRIDSIEGEGKFTRMNFIKTAPLNDNKVRALAEDKDGLLWIAASSGLYIRHPDGKIEMFLASKELPAQYDLLATKDGTVYASTSIGFMKLFTHPSPGHIVERTYTTIDGLPFNGVFTAFQSADGKIWIATSKGIGVLSSTEEKPTTPITSYTMANGLSDLGVTVFAQDRNGNLWIGSDSGGVMRVAANGFSSFTEADGLATRGITSLFNDRTGNLCAITSSSSVNTFDGKQFHSSSLTLPPGLAWDWGWNQITFQDREGEWWMATARGLVRYPDVPASELATQKPKAIYTTETGLPSNEIFRLYEDSRGDIWISTLGNPKGVLTRWDRKTNTFRKFTTDEIHTVAAPTVFREDASGDIWVGLYDGGVLRYRNGRFTLFTNQDGVPRGLIEDIYRDHAGRLWIAADQGGVSRLDNPSAEHPQFVNYSLAGGLSSNQANCVTEDRWGMIYVGTGRGVDAINTSSGRISHYTTADGLVSSNVYAALRDRDGSLWFGTQRGLSRLIPQIQKPSSPPPIVINAVSVSGVARPLPELGANKVELSQLQTTQNNIEIDFAGLSLAAGDSLRYEYKLDGASNQWSSPNSQRLVTYPSLSPGSYRFLVRAVSSTGVVSAIPASVSFTVLPPLWQRWWFIAGAVLLIGATAYVADRYRVARLLELERVRTRIATDLHDDIGASLSRMAILSEVVKQETPADNNGSAGMLTEIADSARGLVDSMSDIVWSIDPSKDDLTNVIQRVRAFASDVLEPQGIQWELDAPSGLENIKLSPDQRRHIYLIFKEAINNVAKHSHAKHARLSLTHSNGVLTTEICDDGKGILTPATGPSLGGNGLKNMRSRVAEMRGTLDVEATQNGGTRLRFTAPLK